MRLRLRTHTRVTPWKLMESHGTKTGIVEAGWEISFSCHTFTICMHTERRKTTNFKDFVTGYHEGLFHRTLRSTVAKAQGLVDDSRSRGVLLLWTTPCLNARSWGCNLSVFLNKILLNRLTDALNGASRILETRYRSVTQRVHRSWLNYKSRITL